MKKAFQSLALLALSLPQITLAAPRNFSEAVNVVVSLFNTGTALLILGGVVVYFWGISTNILKMRDEGSQAFKAYFVWGIIALFVMVSIWGIVELLQNTVFGGNYYSPNNGTPASGSPSANFPAFE